ncbi:hypothetical protein BpHYR1_010811 [Brachionus plicatilis]|uniref:Uncharacterized protein n=1 Tax=Brachionus plicatilis TaxID=10195 RepID=A0A3M7QGM7_BRAPC|nr:hypothetical protein BpHYR1_010811 [Brachionus plicatilis]
MRIAYTKNALRTKQPNMISFINETFKYLFESSHLNIETLYCKEIISLAEIEHTSTTNTQTTRLQRLSRPLRVPVEQPHLNFN